jgi:hypothetical protein
MVVTVLHSAVSSLQGGGVAGDDACLDVEFLVEAARCSVRSCCCRWGAVSRVPIADCLDRCRHRPHSGLGYRTPTESAHNLGRGQPLQKIAA